MNTNQPNTTNQPSPPHPILSIDIETFSPEPLPKCGVYRYVDSPDFEVLLVSYAFDDEPVNTIDLACGEEIPPDVLAALTDPAIIKTAYNAAFERVCLSRHLYGICHITSRYTFLDPAQWRCASVMSAYLTLPARLADVAIALGLTQKKMDEGKDLIRYFSTPCKPTMRNGERTRNLPSHAPEKWETYKAYNKQDVEVERAVRKALEPYPLPEHEWALYALDQRINDRGVRIDKLLVKNAMACDEAFSQQAFKRAQEITGLENPGSVAQLKVWLANENMPMESLAKKIVQEKAVSTEGIVGELLNLRLELSKTSVKKFEAMARTVCRDGRVRGMTQFFGASRTGRWCLAEDTAVLCLMPDGCVTTKPIQCVGVEDRVWDGDAWVAHEGVVYSGDHEVVEWDGVTATRSHIVYVSPTERMSLQAAKEKGVPLWRGNKPC